VTDQLVPERGLIAYHEARHAVAHHHFGIRFIRADGSGGVHTLR
jgi:hypothetical protein